MQQRTSGSVESDSIAFEISDIDPKALLKPSSKQSSKPAPADAKRPELRVIQTDRLPKLELRGKDPIPELISDDSPPEVLPQIDANEDVTSEEETTEVEAIEDPAVDMNVEPEYVDETPELSAGVRQWSLRLRKPERPSTDQQSPTP